MEGKLRLGLRFAVGAIVIFGVLFAVVGQGAHRAAAIGLDASVVSISGSPEVPEGSPAQFTATISPAAAGDFDVDYTATAGGVSGSFHVTAGDTSEPVNVATIDDGTVSPAQRTFTVTLADTNDANGSTVDMTPATGTLDNVDQPPPSAVSIGNANAAVTEGSPATFPVSISPAAGVAFNVSYTATNGGVNGSFHVNQGATSMQVPIATVDNGTPEDDRNFTVTLNGTDASNGSTASGAGTGTIIDNDWTITLSPINPAAVSERGGSIQFAATLNAAAPQQHAISVHYAVADGSAVLGTNYTVSQAASGTLTFAPGNTAKTVTVTGVDDGVYLAGAGKTFTMTLSSPQGAAIAGSASSTGTITDADTAPQMGISSCPTGKVNGGSLAVFPIRVQPASVPATVTYTTVGVNTLPGDFDGGTGTVTIPPGTGSAVREFDLKIPTHAIAPAGSRIFDVQLSSPQGARLTTSLAPCTIVSSGSTASTVPTLQITNPVPVVEPASGFTSVPVTVTLNPPAAQTTPTDVHIHWQTADGSATQPADYTTGGGDLTWAAGTYGPQTFSVQVNSNQARTAQGTFTIAFTSPDSSAGFLGAPTATVTVLPVGSTASVLSIADASAPEKQGSIPVVVTLTPAAATPVTVDYATADGSGAKGAFAGTDYTAKSGTLTFTAGQSTQTISVPITPYSLVEPNKSFQVVLSNPVGATLANSTATLTILNDNVQKVLPPINTGPTQPQKKPVQVPTKRPNTDHPVLVQMLTGESRANAKGQATYRISCPDVVIQLCAGTVTFDVRVLTKPKKGSKKKPALTTVRVGSGTFSVHTGKTGSVVIKLTKPGLALLKSVKRLKVKATINAKDGAGVKGVTAWLVSVAAPPPIVKKPTAKKK